LRRGSRPERDETRGVQVEYRGCVAVRDPSATDRAGFKSNTGGCVAEGTLRHSGGASPHMEPDFPSSPSTGVPAIVRCVRVRYLLHTLGSLRAGGSLGGAWLVGDQQRGWFSARRTKRSSEVGMSPAGSSRASRPAPRVASAWKLLVGRNWRGSRRAPRVSSPCGPVATKPAGLAAITPGCVRIRGPGETKLVALATSTPGCVHAERRRQPGPI
jgi:hypothetical protein